MRYIALLLAILAPYYAFAQAGAGTAIRSTSIPPTTCSGDVVIMYSGLLYVCNGSLYALQGDASNPVVSTGIQYVSLTGSDGNSGLSWALAKATVYAALLALPNGSANPPTAGNGIVLLSGANIPYGGPLAPSGGWYMFGATDPGYAGGVTGWMRAPTNGGSVTVECAVPEVGLVHDHAVACQEYWGNHLTNMQPAIWWNGFSGQAQLRRVTFNYESSMYKLGIDSSGNRATGGLSSVWLDQDGANFGACYSGIGAGPAVDIGGNSFWISITDGSYSGCPTQDYTISAISRTSNVVTVTLNSSGTGDIVAGAANYIIIRNVTDPTFNGAYVIASASGTSLTYAQNGPNASSSGGQAFPYGAAAIGINSGGGPGSGFVYVDDTAVNDGGIWAQGGYNGVGLSVNKLVYEGNFSSPDMSVVELLPTIKNGDTTVYINDVQYADNTVSICGVESTGFGNVSAQNTTVCGGIGTAYGEVNGTVSPLRQGIRGFYNVNYFSGSLNTGRRMSAPYGVRYANLVGDATTWTGNTTNFTFTTGKLAPDATSNALKVANTSGSQQTVYFNSTSGTPNVGDSYVFGMWIQSLISGTAPPAPEFTLNENGEGVGDYCQGSYFSGQGTSAQGAQVAGTPITGDGEWEWFGGICKIVTAPNSGDQWLELKIANNVSVQIYGAVLTIVPASTLSDNEIWELANTLQPYPIAAVASDASMMPGQRLDIGGPLYPLILYSAAGTALPTCNSGTKGEEAVVSDATSPTYMGSYSSGGGVTAAVICSYNGSYAWLTH